MVLAKGLRSQSRYCSAGTDKVASRAVSSLEGRVLTAFVVSFASAMRQLESKSGVSLRFPYFHTKVSGAVSFSFVLDTHQIHPPDLFEEKSRTSFSLLQ